MSKRVMKIISSIAMVGVLTFSGMNFVQAPSAEVIRVFNGYGTKADFDKVLESSKNLKVSDEQKEFYNTIYESFKNYANKKGLKLTEEKIKESVNLLVLLNDETFGNRVFIMGLNHLGLDTDSYLEIMLPIFGEVSEGEKEFYRLVLNTFSFDPESLKAEDKKVYDSIKNNFTSYFEKLGVKYDKGDYEVISSMVWNLANSDIKLSNDLLSYVLVYLEVDLNEFLELTQPFGDKFEPYFNEKNMSIGHMTDYFDDMLVGSLNDSDLEKLVTKLYDEELTFEKFSKHLVGIDNIYENKSEDEIIYMLYRVLLLREVDEEGLSFWKGKHNEFITSGKTNVESFKMIANGIIDGEEFKNIDILSRFGLEGEIDEEGSISWKCESGEVITLGRTDE